MKLLASAPRDARSGPHRTQLGLLTPDGIHDLTAVGHFQQPPRYLAEGDQLSCEIEGIGVLESAIADELPRAEDHATAAGVAELVELAR